MMRKDILDDISVQENPVEHLYEELYESGVYERPAPPPPGRVSSLRPLTSRISNLVKEGQIQGHNIVQRVTSLSHKPGKDEENFLCEKNHPDHDHPSCTKKTSHRRTWLACFLLVFTLIFISALVAFAYDRSFILPYNVLKGEISQPDLYEHVPTEALSSSLYGTTETLSSSRHGTPSNAVSSSQDHPDSANPLPESPNTPDFFTAPETTEEPGTVLTKNIAVKDVSTSDIQLRSLLVLLYLPGPLQGFSGSNTV